jgi:DNA polymerase-3 subunit beta
VNITLPATDLKKIVKKLSAVQSTNIVLRTGSAQADDETMGIVVSYPFETEPVTVNSRLFSSTVNKLTKDVTLQYKGKGPLYISSAKFKAEIPLMIVTPALVQPPSSLSELEIEAKDLSELLSFASQVTDEKNTFDHTGVVQLFRYYEYIEAEATDNLRIVSFRKKISVNAEPLKILISSKIVKAVKELEGTVSISQTNSLIFFQAGDTTIYTRKLTKKFPDVNKVMPQSYKLEVEINTQDFLDVLGRVSPTIDPETSSKVVLDFQGDVLKVQSGNELVGQSEDEIPVNPLIPDALDEIYPLRMAANSNFIKLFLTSVSKCGTIITFKANDKDKPFLMESGSRKILMAGVRL